MKIRHDHRGLTHSRVENIGGICTDLYIVFLDSAVIPLIAFVLSVIIGVGSGDQCLTSGTSRILHSIGEDIPISASHAGY